MLGKTAAQRSTQPAAAPNELLVESIMACPWGSSGICFVKSWPWMTYLLNILCREHAQRSFVDKAGTFKDNYLGDGFELWAELATFFQKSFTWKDNWNLFIPFWASDRHLFKQEWSCWAQLCCLFTGNPLIKFKLSSENENFKKLVSTTLGVTASQYIKAFLMRQVVILMWLLDTV